MNSGSGRLLGAIDDHIGGGIGVCFRDARAFCQVESAIGLKLKTHHGSRTGRTPLTIMINQRSILIAGFLPATVFGIRAGIAMGVTMNRHDRSA